MSYSTIFQCAEDLAFQHRITSCCAQEGAADPVSAMGAMIWQLATAADIEAAYASAIAGDNPDPGGDASVITDAMILGLVQANLPTP